MNSLLELFNSSAFELPNFLSDVNSWHGHMPFAFWCMQAIKPRIFVELGTYKGDSYLTF